MEIYFNELSLMPRCQNVSEARNKVINLIATMKEIRAYDFNILRTHDNFYAEELAEGYNFSNFINDKDVSVNTRLLLISIVKNPFIADEDSYEAEVFILDSFTTTDHENKIVTPEGLAIAHIFNSPTISLQGYPKWENETLLLSITTNSTNQTSIENIVNLGFVESIKNKAFVNWIKSLTEGIQFNSEQNIISYFTPNQFEFDKQAINDILSWYYDDKRYIIRIKELILDIVGNPFNGGKGHTEILSNTNGKASKSIIKKDRILYTYTKEKIVIHQCRGHYDDN